MPHLRLLHALVVAAVLVLASACASGPAHYALRGDACNAVSVDTFEQLSGGPPTSRTPTGLAQGLDGGYCEMEFDGHTGYVKLAAFIAIHPNGDEATVMYTQLRTHDLGHVRDGAAVTDVPHLGSAAYLERQNLSGDLRTWRPTDNSLYKYGVEDGNLVLTLTFSGYAESGSDWPTSEQALRDEIESSVQQIMKTLAS